MNAERRSTRVVAIAESAVVFCGMLAIYWMGNGRTSLWDRDEPRYAGTAHNMVHTGDYIVPYFNGQFRFTKPVLTYWTIAASFKLLGESEFAARAPSGVAMAAACVVVVWLGNRHFGRPAGLVAAAILGLSPMAIFLGKLCIPDGLQMLFGTIAFGCQWMLCVAAASPNKANFTTRQLEHAAFGFWLATAFAVLTKGPIVPAMSAAALLLHKFLCHVPWRNYRFRLLVGIGVLASVAGPWYLTIYWLTGAEFFREAAGNQLFNRVHKAFDKSIWPPGYYAVSVAGGILPWLGFFWLAAKRGYHRLLIDSNLAYLTAWTFGSMAVLELFQSKQPHYYAPAYPAICLFVADALARMLRGEIAWRFDRVARNAVLAGATLAAIGAFFLPWTLARIAADSSWMPLLFGGIIACCFFVGGLAAWRGRLEIGLSMTATAAAAIWALISVWALPALSDRCVARAIAQQLAKSDGSASPIALHRVIEPSLIYYSGLELPMLYRHDELEGAIGGARTGVLCVMTNGELNEFEQKFGGTAKVVQSFHGLLKMRNDTVYLVHLAESSNSRAMDSAESRQATVK